MILCNVKSYALGALLVVLAAPAHAAAPGRPAEAARPATTGSQSADATRSRRVELPFPLDFRSPESAPRPSARPENTGPHPFRESLLKRASLDDANRVRRLSRHPNFS